MAPAPVDRHLASATNYFYRVPHQPATMRAFFDANRFIVWSGVFEGQRRSEGMIYEYDAGGGLGSWRSIPTAGAPTLFERALNVKAATPFYALMDDALFSAGKMQVWLRAGDLSTLQDAKIQLAEFDPATNVWVQHPTAVRETAGRQSALYRNFPHVFPTEKGLLFWGGRDPEQVDWINAPHYQNGFHHIFR